ncbi:FecR family protein [Janthinobacterium fluminis]|uniref:FecR domain-containing protein n=1 Tax=Janthinobacterium fluminis TaxID=2987524 RepID=A0ABT5JUD1_9BURK|nr:FecR domain-containing protein [Janthinobacterium fluminis]MDC8756368.1 FecR domain-containing protein [Janthinobacterium fluminis]
MTPFGLKPVDQAARAANIDIAAAQWLLRRDAGLGPDDLAALQQWLDADPAHALAWAQMCDTDALLARLPAARVAAFDRSGRGHAAPAPWLRWLRRCGGAAPRRALTACALALCCLAGSELLYEHGRQADYAQTFATARGQYASQTLPDGSTVELDTGTVLQVSLYDDRREVRLLRGQAMFHVSHDASRPFRVYAEAASVTVLGTRFSVRNVGGMVNVAVQQGKVAVAAPGRDAAAAPLWAGDGLNLAANGQSTPANVVPAAVGSWRDGRVNFDNATLAEALAEFERYADTGLVLGDPALGQLRLSGSFDVGKPAQFAAALPLALPVRLVGDGRAQRILAR